MAWAVFFKQWVDKSQAPMWRTNIHCNSYTCIFVVCKISYEGLYYDQFNDKKGREGRKKLLPGIS